MLHRICTTGLVQTHTVRSLLSVLVFFVFVFCVGGVGVLKVLLC